MCRATKLFDMSASKNKGTKWATLELVEDPPAPETVSQPITGPISEKVPRTIVLHGNVSVVSAVFVSFAGVGRGVAFFSDLIPAANLLSCQMSGIFTIRNSNVSCRDSCTQSTRTACSRSNDGSTQTCK